MHRFLGYDLKNMTNQYVAFVLDLVLLIIFTATVKPLAMLLIYLELICCANYLCCRYLFLLYISTIKRLLFLSVEKDMKRKLRVWTAYLDCLSCLMSLSLFLRWFSGRPSPKSLRKNDRLVKSSILYRIFRHII